LSHRAPTTADRHRQDAADRPEARISSFLDFISSFTELPHPCQACRLQPHLSPRNPGTRLRPLTSCIPTSLTPPVAGLESAHKRHFTSGSLSWMRLLPLVSRRSRSSSTVTQTSGRLCSLPSARPSMMEYLTRRRRTTCTPKSLLTHQAQHSFGTTLNVVRTKLTVIILLRQSLSSRTKPFTVPSSTSTRCTTSRRHTAISNVYWRQQRP
jgi:hypothetical protein